MVSGLRRDDKYVWLQPLYTIVRCGSLMYTLQLAMSLRSADLPINFLRGGIINPEAVDKSHYTENTR